jgi:hypothetical protein
VKKSYDVWISATNNSAAVAAMTGFDIICSDPIDPMRLSE